MRKGGVAFTERSREVSPLATSILSVQRKVSTLEKMAAFPVLTFAGWTPSTFVSSRSTRAKKKVSRPEDFMDDEDLQEMKESMTLVDTTDAMDLTGSAEAELGRRAAEDYESESVLPPIILIPDE